MQKMKLLVLVLAAQLLWVDPSMEQDDDSMIMQVFEELNKRIEAVKGSCQGQCAGTKVAFTAVLHPPKTKGLGTFGPFSDVTVLKHAHVITNIGKAYSPTTGKFTAPVDGTYFFTFTTYAWATKASIGLALYQNEKEMVRVYEHQDSGDDEDYGTNSVALALKKGDTVSLRLPKDFQASASVEDNRATFSGFLLY